MVHSDFPSELVNNGVEDPSPEKSPFAWKASCKGAGSDSSDEEKEGQIRVGREYQAVPPPFIPPSERREDDGEERALLVWAPCSGGIEDAKLDQFILMAKEKYGYNSEQALGMMFWHKHDLEGAMQDLANFTPFSDNWNLEDVVLFEQAFRFHGKSFQRIRQMLPDKSIADLVKYYYSWKKTRSRTSMMDRHARKVAEVREEGLYGEENYPEDSTGTDKEVSEGLGLEIKKKNEIRDTDAKTRPSPPKGIKINHEDLVAFASGQGEQVLNELESSIASCKRVVQNNKQLISALHRKAREVDVTTLRVEQPEDAVSARWTDQELLLGVQGVKMYGKDFSSIASILGTKTAADVETFFNSYNLRFGLDSICLERESLAAGE